MVLFLSYLYPNVINIIVLLLKLHPIVLPEIYKHATVTALLISFDACYAPSAPARSVFVCNVLVDKLRGHYIQGVIRTHNVPTILWLILADILRIFTLTTIGISIGI